MFVRGVLNQDNLQVPVPGAQLMQIPTQNLKSRTARARARGILTVCMGTEHGSTHGPTAMPCGVTRWWRRPLSSQPGVAP